MNNEENLLKNLTAVALTSTIVLSGYGAILGVSAKTLPKENNKEGVQLIENNVNYIQKSENGEDKIEYRRIKFPSRYRVISDYLNVRSGPGINYKKVGKLKYGDVIWGVYEYGWVKFKYKGNTCFVSIQYLTQD